MNTFGFYTLLKKEVRRFMVVMVQTVLTPVITSLLYLLVFSHVLQGRIEVYEGISYLYFLVPGLIMMSVIQNSYANTTSTIMQSKMVGSITFLLLAPLSSLEIYLAYIGAAIARGVMVGIGVYLGALIFVDLPVAHPIIVFLFLMGTSALLGSLGMIAGIWANQFEQMAMFQNFLILPLSFLSGVFYSINQLPSVWQTASHFNPFFYMVDGFRYGFLGVSDISPWLSLTVLLIALAIISTIVLMILKSGYKLRN